MYADPTDLPASPVGVVTTAAAEALGAAFAEPQPDRDALGKEIEKVVRDAVEGANQGAAAARLHAQVQQAQEAVARLAAQNPAGNVSITREGNNVIIHTHDGRTITLDRSIVPEEAIGGLVGSLGAPPPPPPPPDFVQRGPPDNVVRLVGVIFVCLTLMVVFGLWARAFARRAQAKASAAGATPPDLALRLERIEQAVDAMAVEMERVSEAQRYSARLLTERLPESWQQIPGGQASQRAGQTAP